MWKKEICVLKCVRSVKAITRYMGQSTRMGKGGTQLHAQQVTSIIEGKTKRRSVDCIPLQMPIVSYVHASGINAFAV